MEKGAFLGKAVAKVKKSLGIGKKTRSMLSPQKLLEAQKKDPALGRNWGSSPKDLLAWQKKNPIKSGKKRDPALFSSEWAKEPIKKAGLGKVLSKAKKSGDWSSVGRNIKLSEFFNRRNI